MEGEELEREDLKVNLDYSDLDDVALLSMIVQARTEALSELYDRYGRLVYSLAIHILGDSESAEEVTQDVFLRVWGKAGTYRAEQARVSTWLTSIARNRAIDVLRQRRVRPEGQSISWGLLTPNRVPKIEGRSPEETATRSLTNRRIKDAIARLPENQQSALILAFFYGYSHSQIAAQLQEPLGTVKTRIRMAMQKLRVILKE
jgi:RNA polymerase sigma-70 factor, ECF subfamily